MKPVVLLLGLPALVLGLAAAALAQTYTIVDVPDAGGTWPVSINNGGDVAGYFCRNVGGYCSDYQARGFVREFNGNITAFDGIPTSINDLGTVTGYFFDTTGLHNFLRDRKGNVTVFDVPQPFPPSPAAGFAMAMNNGGDIAGYLIPCPNCDTDQGFVRDRLGGITTFVIPKGLVTTGINARGDITGHTAPFYLSEDGFVRGRDGNITIFDVGSGPGPRAYCVSINNGGDVAGYYYDASLRRARGFVRARNGNITVFDGIPNALYTRSASINELGAIAGDVGDAAGSHNFLRDRIGNVTVFDVPNAFVARSISINNRGDVAGYFYELRNGGIVTHGFVRSVH